MINKQLTLLVAICVLFVTNSFSQRPNYSISNSIGPLGGITQSNILTDNFITKEGQGFTAGLGGTVNIEHRWYDVSYAIQFVENTIAIQGGPTLGGNAEMIDFKLAGAQLSLLMHAKIYRYNLAIDFGPIIQANGFFEPAEQEKGEYILSGYDALQAKDIRDISKLNVNGAIGATAGIKNFRVRAQYQYGLTNVFRKLNNQDLSVQDVEGVDEFKGNQATILLTALILL